MNRMMIIIAALLFSTAGAAIKGTTLTGFQVASFRSLVAVIFLFIILPKARVLPSKKILMVCVAYAMTVIFFVLSNKLTTAANSIFLQSASPLYIMLLSPFFLKEKIKRSDLLLIIPIVAGIALLFAGTSGSGALSSNPILGNILACCAGVCWAFLIMGLRFLKRDDDANKGIILLLWGNLLASAISMPFALPVQSFLMSDVFLILFLGVIQISIAYLFMLKGLSKVPAFEASLLLLFEPAFSPIIAWLVHKETVTLITLLGAGLIFLATILKSYFQQMNKRSTKPLGLV